MLKVGTFNCERRMLCLCNIYLSIAAYIFGYSRYYITSRLTISFYIYRRLFDDIYAATGSVGSTFGRNVAEVV